VWVVEGALFWKVGRSAGWRGWGRAEIQEDGGASERGEERGGGVIYDGKGLEDSESLIGREGSWTGEG
jgi:hypothetical protein